ncbi:MAG: hypothetical protein ABIO39_03600 [Caulobacteraceae bacterium]
MRALAFAVIAAGLALQACAPAVEAPTDRGVCFHTQPLKGGKLRFNKLSENEPDLEHCAARLEAMRLQFLRLGGSSSEVWGSFQGQFLFLRAEGVFTAPSLTAIPYLALVRAPGGRLVTPGSASGG